jgi:hypothetical protein
MDTNKHEFLKLLPPDAHFNHECTRIHKTSLTNICRLFVSIRVNWWLVLFPIRRNLWQDRRLQQPLLFFLRGINWHAARINQMHGRKDDQVAFDVLIDSVAKKPTEQWNVADDRRSIFRLLHILAHQTAQHHGLAVPHTHVRSHLARAEDWLVNHILGEENVRLG